MKGIITMPMRNILWQLFDEKPRPEPLPEPAWLHPNGGAMRLQSERGAASVLVAPIPPLGDHVAVVLVAPNALSDVSCNGRPLSAGLWALRHADRLDVDGRSIWIAVETSVDETHYDPALHGADVYCLLTKKRLAVNDAIAICPGTPGKSCGAVYSLAAWRLAQKSTRPFKCPGCGYSPAKAVWQPETPQPNKTLEKLLEIIAQASL
jgi:hypothetical protein